MKHIYGSNLILATALILTMAGCSGEAETGQSAPEVPAQSESSVLIAPETSAIATEVEEPIEAEPAVNVKETTVTQNTVKEAVAMTELEESGQIEEGAPASASEQVKEVSGEAPAKTTELPASQERIQFTATTGLEKFSAYRMMFESTFDGTRQNQPTNGTLSGLLEVTTNPQAQHLQVNMQGDAFSELALLGGKMELYDIGDTFYIQNPQDGSWIGVPAMLVDSLLPQDMYRPEDNIELPVTAVLQPGEETINGVITRRYTFDAQDMAGDKSNYDQVEGTIWVAVEGNYVVQYQAVVTGQHGNLTAGDIKLLDEGTISMMYQVTDVDGGFTIAPPQGATAINLTDLLFSN